MPVRTWQVIPLVARIATRRGQQVFLYHLGHSLRKRNLDREIVGPTASTGIGEHLHLITHVNQLGSHANSAGSKTDTAFQNKVHLQAASNLRDIAFGVLVPHRGGVSNDSEPSRIESRKLNDEFVSQSVFKAIFLMISGKISKRQDR